MHDETTPEFDPGAPGDPSDLSETRARHELVSLLAARGIADDRVLAAMAAVERHRYVDREWTGRAYDDRPLPIGVGQTISQPYIVAYMAEAAEIEPDDSVLEVGTGSGYGAAVLGHLAGNVWSIERHGSLAESARQRLRRDGLDHVNVMIGDGARGWQPAAPYRAIVVTASPPSIPDSLLDQLADGGRLIIPVGRRRRVQSLIRVRRTGDELQREDLGPVRFVPLV